MLDHFPCSELACPTPGEVGFGDALARLRVRLDEPIYLNKGCRSPLLHWQQSMCRRDGFLYRWPFAEPVYPGTQITAVAAPLKFGWAAFP